MTADITKASTPTRIEDSPSRTCFEPISLSLPRAGWRHGWHMALCSDGGGTGRFVVRVRKTDSVADRWQMLPWDWDIDTQVSESTLTYMAQHHNGTKYDYVSKDGQTKRTYLLDVNPAIVERLRGNGNNVIDARWIDTSNGLYIDITGLSETHPDDQPGVWSCKNYHRYHTTDLYPMRDTLYEGVGAKVPYAYDRILIQEYKENALIVTEYEG